MKRTAWWVGLAALAGSGLLTAGIASAANVTIHDDDISGVVITPDNNFELGVNVTQHTFESASLSGSWIALTGRVGSGIIYITEQDQSTTALSDILYAEWGSSNPGGFSTATIDLTFLSDTDGTLSPSGLITQAMIDAAPTFLANGWVVPETGLLQGLTGQFRNLATGDLVSLPSNLTVFAQSDVVPEPSTLILLGMGLAGFAVVGRKRMQG